MDTKDLIPFSAPIETISVEEAEKRYPPTTALPILHTAQSSGSPHGLSSYSGWAHCARKATLDAEVRRAKLTGQPGDILGHNAFRATTSADNFATRVGTIYHAYMEAHYKGLFGADAPFAIEIGDDLGWDNLDVAQNEAERLFRAYVRRFPQEEFEVLGVELAVPEPLDDGSYRLEEMRAVAQAVGINPYTCRLDLLIRLSPEQAAMMALTRNISVEPGVWVWDHKTARDRRKNEAEARLQSLQATAYPLAWNALEAHQAPRDFCVALEAKGTIFSSTYRLKETPKNPKGPDFRTFVAPLEEGGIRQLHSFLKGIEVIKGDPFLSSWANAEKCFDKLSLSECYWRSTGVCNGA